VSGVDDRMREYIRNYMMSKSPGMYVLLRRVIHKELGMDLTEALIKKPRRVLEVLKEFYRDDIEAMFVFRTLFLKPLALLAGNPEVEEELYRASMHGCSSLVKILRTYGVSIDPSVCRD